jgi:heme-degrading monooxygenase HmoA
MAVKILIKRKIKDGNMQAAARLLINSRKGAMTQPGYISSETMRSLDDPTQVVVMSMWQNKENWQSWKESPARKEIQEEFEQYLIGSVEYENYSLGLSIE